MPSMDGTDALPAGDATERPDAANAPAPGSRPSPPAQPEHQQIAAEAGGGEGDERDERDSRIWRPQPAAHPADGAAGIGSPPHRSDRGNETRSAGSSPTCRESRSKTSRPRWLARPKRSNRPPETRGSYNGAHRLGTAPPSGASAVRPLIYRSRRPTRRRAEWSWSPDRVGTARAAPIVCSARARGVAWSRKKHGPGTMPGPCGSSSGASGRLRETQLKALADEGEVVIAAGGVGDGGAAVGRDAQVGQVGDAAAVDRPTAPGVADADGVAGIAAAVDVADATAPPLAEDVATPPFPADAVSVNCMMVSPPL